MPTSAACRLLLAALASGAAASHAQTGIPMPGARITDLTGTLSGEAVNRIETKLADFETRQGTPVAVLMVGSTLPEDLERFGGRVALKWRLGSKAFDDGAIILVAKDDRRVRLEVGHGLAKLLPDALGNRLIADTMIPHFEIGDYDGGIAAGVDRLTAVIDGASLVPPDTGWESRGAMSGTLLPLALAAGLVIVLAARILTPARTWLGSGRSSRGSSTAPGARAPRTGGGASGCW